MLLIPCISSIHCSIIDAYKHVGLMNWRNPRSRQKCIICSGKLKELQSAQLTFEESPNTQRN